MTPAKKIVFVNAGAVFALLSVFEIIVRVALPPNTPFRERRAFNIQYDPSGVVAFLPEPNQVIYAVDDGVVSTTDVKYRFNEYGFRGDPFPVHKPDGDIRIAILGGSHVFDPNALDYEGNPGFPRLIQDRFREMGLAVTVINAGVPGSDTRYFPARVLLDLSRYQVDVVVVSSIWNDTKWVSRTTPSTMFVAAPPLAASNPLVEPVGILDRAFGSSVLYRKTRDLYWTRKLRLAASGSMHEGVSHPVTNEVQLELGLGQYGTNILGTVAAIRAINAIPVLALEERLVSAANGDAEKERIGYSYVNVDSHESLVRIYAGCDSIIRLVSSTVDVSLIDANAEVEGNLAYFADHTHVTPAGSRKIAESYVEFLRPVVERALSDRAMSSGS